MFNPFKSKRTRTYEQILDYVKRADGLLLEIKHVSEQMTDSASKMVTQHKDQNEKLLGMAVAVAELTEDVGRLKSSVDELTKKMIDGE